VTTIALVICIALIGALMLIFQGLARIDRRPCPVKARPRIPSNSGSSGS
jgi:hypothetical protein